MSDDIYYRHLRMPQSVKKDKMDGVTYEIVMIPYGTIAAKIISTSGCILGASLCSPSDQFSYKRGREIAGFRLQAIENGKFPKQLAAFVPEVQTREQCINLISRLEIIREDFSGNRSMWNIYDPQQEYEFHYHNDILLPKKTII